MEEHLLSFLPARQGHFQFESGHHGDLWLELETLCLRSREIQPFAAELAARLSHYNLEAVCGPLVEGAYIALLVSLELGCDFVYAERFANPSREGLFPVVYRLPKALHGAVRSKRVAIVNDVISAGSAVRGAFRDLQSVGRKSWLSERFSGSAIPSPNSRKKTASRWNFCNKGRTTCGHPRSVRFAQRASRSRSEALRRVGGSAGLRSGEPDPFILPVCRRHP